VIIGQLRDGGSYVAAPQLVMQSGPLAFRRRNLSGQAKPGRLAVGSTCELLPTCLAPISQRACHDFSDFFITQLDGMFAARSLGEPRPRDLFLVEPVACQSRDRKGGCQLLQPRDCVLGVARGWSVSRLATSAMRGDAELVMEDPVLPGRAHDRPSRRRNTRSLLACR
jgi:hypothetical protein